MNLLVATLLTLQSPLTGTWHHVTRADGLPGNEVRAVLSTTTGTVWFAVRGLGLAAFDGSTWRYATAEDGLVSNGVAAIREVGDAIWAVGQGGYSVLTDGVWRPFDSVGDRRTRVVFSVTTSERGELWLAANGRCRATV